MYSSTWANLMTKFHLLSLFIALALCQTTENDTITDHATSSNYRIILCKGSTSGSHVAYLQALIPFMQRNLQAVLTDLDRGTASPAYRAFFKTNNNLDNVRQVFEDIVNASAVFSDGPEDEATWMSPTIMCADTDDEDLRHVLMGHCNVPPRPAMYVVQPGKFTTICPIFWTLPRIARKAACPWVSDGRLLTEPFNLVATQFEVLVHEFVHVYNRFDNREEVYNMADVVGLSAERSLENAQNYASYAAAIQAGCKNFPTLPASGSGDDVCRGRCLDQLNGTLNIVAPLSSNITKADGGTY